MISGIPLLRKAFCDWIGTIHIDGKDSGYLFGNNCFCINFNYTDTLQKRFHAVHECHIHGEADDPESIVFGHSAHPQRAIQELAQFGGRFLGLYLIEEALYETDKHVYENIQFLRVDMASADVKLDQIKDIYVLGHSFGPADYGYFEYIMKETSVKGTHNRKNIRQELVDTMDELQLRIQYAIHRYGEGKSVSKEEQEAVERRLLFEQAFDEEDILGNFYPVMPELKRSGRCTEDARWHISYFSGDDKRQIVSSIDQCIECFKVNAL